MRKKQHHVRSAASALQFIYKSLAVLLTVRVHRNYTALQRGQPGGESAHAVLCEDAKEALHRPKYSAVNHDGLLLDVAAVYVLHFEALGKVEVQLDGGTLPLAPNGVLRPSLVSFERRYTIDGQYKIAFALCSHSER